MVVPVVADPSARGVQSEFRLPEDPEYVIRINQPPPRGLPRKFAEFVPVAGTSQPDTLPIVHAFICGSNRQVELRRMPEHLVDPNAIVVIGCWKEGGIDRSGRLGYLPADLASQLSNEEKEMAIGATLKVMYMPAPERNAGVRLDVWAPRRPKERVKELPCRKDLRVPSNSVERNLRGIVLEREGLIDNAIECYEANVREGFQGNHPYDRLAIIFRRRGDITREIAVLQRAIEVFEELLSSERSDVSPKLEKFRQRLRSAMERRGSQSK